MGTVRGRLPRLGNAGAAECRGYRIGFAAGEGLAGGVMSCCQCGDGSLARSERREVGFEGFWEAEGAEGGE